MNWYIIGYPGNRDVLFCFHGQCQYVLNYADLNYAYQIEICATLLLHL